MKKIFSPLWPFLSFIIFVGNIVQLPAQTYFVSPTGDDMNTCIDAGSACLTIVGALSKVPSSGGVTIDLAPGTYTVSSSININKPNILIEGKGVSSTIVQINNATNAVFQQSSNGATISKLRISSSVATLNAGIEVNGATSGLTIENLEFNKLGTPTGAENGSNGSGIRILNSFSGLSVTNSKFISAHQGIKSGSSGIACTGAVGNSVGNITIQNCTFDKLFIGFWAQVAVDGLTAEGNSFSFETPDGYSGSAGFYLGDLTGSIKNIRIENNTFTSYTRGIYVFNYSTGPVSDSKLLNVKILNNVFTNSVWSSAIRLITQNNSTMEEILIEGNVITQASNNFTKSLGFIDLRQGKLPVATTDNNIRIIKNCITFSAGGAFQESTWGILLRGRGIGAIQLFNNNIQGNNVGGQSSPELDAYPIPPSSGIVIQTQFEGTGISSDFGSLTSSAEIAIANNYVNGFNHPVNNGYALLFYRRNDLGAVPLGPSVVAGGIPAGARIFIEENHFADNKIAISTGTTLPSVGINISGKSNWFGSANPAIVFLMIESNLWATFVDFLPVGTETNGTNDPPSCGNGFQPNGSCCCGN